MVCLELIIHLFFVELKPVKIFIKLELQVWQQRQQQRRLIIKLELQVWQQRHQQQRLIIKLELNERSRAAQPV